MKKIQFPESWTSSQWYGFTRYDFTFENYKAFLVEPKYPAGDGRWNWCMVWPDSFVERVATPLLLEHGFYHVHIDLFATKASPEGVKTMVRFYDFLTGLGLAKKCALQGLSWGGYFSLRFASENPEKVASLYLDAPVCNAADPHESAAGRVKAICEQYGKTREELETSPLNPLNHLEGIAKASFPIHAEIGLWDLAVNIETNIFELEKRLAALGKNITMNKRNFWGHHPHGVDDPERLLAFHCKALEEA